MLRQYPDNQAEMGKDAFIKPEHMHTDARSLARTHARAHANALKNWSDEQKESAEAHGKLSAVNVVHYDSAALLWVMQAGEERNDDDDYCSTIRTEGECQIISSWRTLLRNN